MKQMKNTNVISLFLEDHERISQLLTEFKKLKHKNIRKAKDIFKQLHQDLIRHFHQEKILYSRYKQTTGDILPILQTINKEHTTILEKLLGIQRSLAKEDTNIDISDLYAILEKHKNVEDRLLYPEFERILSEKEKEDMYWKMKVR